MLDCIRMAPPLHRRTVEGALMDACRILSAQMFQLLIAESEGRQETFLWSKLAFLEFLRKWSAASIMIFTLSLH